MNNVNVYRMIMYKNMVARQNLVQRNESIKAVKSTVWHFY